MRIWRRHCRRTNGRINLKCFFCWWRHFRRLVLALMIGWLPGEKFSSCTIARWMRCASLFTTMIAIFTGHATPYIATCTPYYFSRFFHYFIIEAMRCRLFVIISQHTTTKQICGLFRMADGRQGRSSVRLLISRLIEYRYFRRQASWDTADCLRVCISFTLGFIILPFSRSSRHMSCQLACRLCL